MGSHSCEVNGNALRGLSVPRLTDSEKVAAVQHILVAGEQTTARVWEAIGQAEPLGHLGSSAVECRIETCDLRQVRPQPKA